MTSFVDSAYAPTVAQVQAAVAQGCGAWAFYLAGPGALNNWTAAQVEVLRQGGLSQGLPIFVPALDLSGNAQSDASSLADAMAACGVYGVGVLDTEASMRGNPNLVPYVNAFVSTLQARGITAVVYGGGNYVPTGVAPWWIIPNATAAPNGEAYQVGKGSIDGLSVDQDIAGAGFPLASLTTPPAPFTPIVINYPEDNMQSITSQVEIASGHGWIPSPVPAATVVNVVVQDEDPGAVDRYDDIPVFQGAASGTAQGAPNGALVFAGPSTMNGTYGVVIWAA